jgi:FkbM family methyltransferase
MIDEIKGILKHHVPSLHSALSRLKNRLFIWRMIHRDLHTESLKDNISLILSALYDSVIYSVIPHLALSPKSFCNLQLYSPRLGTKFYVRGRTDDIYNILPFREMDVHDAILKKLRRGDVFIDGGANIGYYTILGARAVGAQGTVVSIEAAQSTAKQLAYNLKLNHIENVITINKAIQNDYELSATELAVANKNYGMATMLNTKSENKIRKLRVSATTIDEICSIYDHLRMIKLDIEGMELAALLGAKNTLVKTDYVVIECNESKAEIYDLLSKLGFCVQELNFSTYILGYRNVGSLDFHLDISAGI